MAPRMIRPADDPVQPAPAGAVRVIVDGEPFDGVAGQTIAGVLLANGVLGWRTTAGTAGRAACSAVSASASTAPPRSTACRDVRCCQRRAADGDVVVTAQHGADPMTPVVVVGAGPAGMEAAAAPPAERGADVTLLDGADQLGGQFWRHLPAGRTAAGRILHHGWDTSSDSARRWPPATTCRWIPGASVWAIEPGARP